MNFMALILCLLLVSFLSSKGILCNDIEHEDDDYSLMDPSSSHSSYKPKCHWIVDTFQTLLTHKEREIFKLGVKFFLSTRNHQGSAIISFTRNNEIEQMYRPFDRVVRKGKKTVLIAHGYRNSAEETWVEDMVKAFLKKEDANVIAVDWSKGANTLNYFNAVKDSATVSRAIVKLLELLARQYDVLPSRVHLVGHSLGAHIMAFVCDHVKSSHGTKIGRLTALDPASLCFGKANQTSLRVDAGDANFVDVIHTNGWKRSMSSFGLKEPVGHVDFYPNRGKKQPFCVLKDVAGGIWNGIVGRARSRRFLKHFKRALCSHSIATDYFTESLTSDSCHFWGHKWTLGDAIPHNLTCNATICSPMGFDADKFPARGTFFVPVRGEIPFCVNDRSAEISMKKFFVKGK